MCSKGKVEAFRVLQQQLAEKMQAAFPAVAADYQHLRQQSVAAPEAAAAAAAAPAAAPTEAVT
jgi:hypothetical protein